MKEMKNDLPIEEVEVKKPAKYIDSTPPIPAPKDSILVARFPLTGVNGRIEKGQEVKEGDIHCSLAYAQSIGLLEYK